MGCHSKDDLIFRVLGWYSGLLLLCATWDQTENLHNTAHYNSVLKYLLLILFSLTCGSLQDLLWTLYTGLKIPFINFFSCKTSSGWMSDTFLLLGGGVKVLGRLKHGSFLQSEQVRRVSEIEGEKESARWKLTVFCKLIFEVTPHHFCLILFVRSKSLNQVTHNQKRLHRASCKGMGITGSPCRSSPPQSSLISLITIF